MAVDIRVPSLYAEPRRIIDVDDAVEKLRTVLPDLDANWLRTKLSGEKGFVWIKRKLTPEIEDKIYQLGIPGLDFLTESKRFYPGGPEASHILGSVNVDNQGIGGIEQYVDGQGLAQLQSVGIADGQNLKPVQLTIDMRIQHVMRQQLLDALTRYKAHAAAAVMIDVKTGRGRRAGVAARLRPERSVVDDRALQRRKGDALQSHHRRQVRARLDLQDHHHRRCARQRHGEDDRPVLTPASACASAASPSTDFHGQHRILSGA